MREWYLEHIQQRIDEKSQSIHRAILRNRSQRVVRRRPRDLNEQKILDMLCKKRWERAIKEGKVKILNAREWYYDVD